MANNGYLSHTILLSYPVFPFVALRINWAVRSDCNTNVAWLASTDVVVPLICFAKKNVVHLVEFHGNFQKSDTKLVIDSKLVGEKLYTVTL